MMLRSMMLAVTLLLTTTLDARPAEACGGGYGQFQWRPAVLEVTSHHAPAVRATGRRAGKTRWFVTLSRGTRPDGLTWKPIAPHSFDWTEIAEAPDLAQPVTLTLLGRAGTRVVSARRVVYLSSPHDATARTAVELEVSGDDDWAVALRGDLGKAAWDGLTYPAADAATRKWASTQGLDPRVAVTRVAGTTLEIVQGNDLTSRGGGARAIVRDRQTGGVVKGLRADDVLGTFVFDGTRYLATRERGTISATRL